MSQRLQNIKISNGLQHTLLNHRANTAESLCHADGTEIKNIRVPADTGVSSVHGAVTQPSHGRRNNQASVTRRPNRQEVSDTQMSATVFKLPLSGGNATPLPDGKGKNPT